MGSSPQNSASPKSNDCQRFFGYGKKIPKNVKRHCGMCKQHGATVETRGHICPFKDCDCKRCELIRRRRSIMSTQIRLRREQDKKFQRTTDASEADIVPWTSTEPAAKPDDAANMCYFCQKCKNHGVLMWKKDHKKVCEYANCRCEQCDLIDSRRALDRHIKQEKSSKRALDGGSVTASDESNSSISCSPEVQSESSFQGISSMSLASLVGRTSTSPAFEKNPAPLMTSSSSPPSSSSSSLSMFGATPMLTSTPPMFFPTMPSLSYASFCGSPSMSIGQPMIGAGPGLFFPGIASLEMQIFFANMKCLSDFAVAVSSSNQ